MGGAATADVVVVGAGINGAAISFYLAQAGLKVIVLEATRPGAGASSRGAGIIRTYHHLEAEAALAIRSLSTFRNWKHEIGGSCGYKETGFLWIVGPDDVAAARATVATQVRAGAISELIDPRAIESLQPHLSIDAIGAAVFEPQGGFGDPMIATNSLHAAAFRLGAELRVDSAVASLEKRSGRITGVKTAAGSMVSAPFVVLAAGAWSGRLVENLGNTIPVVPTRMTTGTIRHAVFKSPPMTFIDTVYDTFFRPGSTSGAAHISIRDRRHNTAVSPTSGWQDDVIAPDATAAGISRLAQRIPSLDAKADRAWAGLDGVTSDYRPIYGAVPQVQGLYLCVGGNFKGFKVAPAVGRCLAQLIMVGSSDLDLSDFSIDRFASAVAPEVPPHYALSSVA